jgi:uncharacterized membrane protein
LFHKAAGCIAAVRSRRRARSSFRAAALHRLRKLTIMPVLDSQESSMQGIKRKAVYVIVFEAIAILICTVSFALASDKSVTHAGALSIANSIIAVAWNLMFTTAFEAWEARQITRGRSIRRRIAHAVVFETGLLVLLVPLTAWWLDITMMQAFVLDIGLAGLFLVYTFAFNWSFDRIFGLPASAQ